MKPIYCKKCGNKIQSGYAVNPETSAICEMCYIEAQDKLKEDLGINDRGVVGD